MSESLKPIRTSPFLTKYEKSRVVGTRAEQISNGCPSNIEVEGEIDPMAIAEKELYEGKSPLIVRRYLPNHEYEDVSVSNLIVTI